MTPETRKGRKPKVWGVIMSIGPHPAATIHGQVRAIVLANSRAKAAEALGVRDSFLRDYGSETSNHAEVEAATAKPGSVFIHGLLDEGPFYERGES